MKELKVGAKLIASFLLSAVLSVIMGIYSILPGRFQIILKNRQLNSKDAEEANKSIVEAPVKFSEITEMIEKNQNLTMKWKEDLTVEWSYEI